MGGCWSISPKNEPSSASGRNSRYGTSSRGGGCRGPSSDAQRTPRAEGEILRNPNVRIFRLSELEAATNKFDRQTFLGEGGFGRVYKGYIDGKPKMPRGEGNGMPVAIKDLEQGGFQGHDEWLREIDYLGRLSHPNLVRLIGYCSTNERRLLVYEFVALGSLDNHLFRNNNNVPGLSWRIRMKIALGAARGLAQLHNDNTAYRDMKSANILLDSDYNAKLSDLGLARDGPTGDQSHVTTRAMGTLGYAAPEYISTGHLTLMTDVFGFGVLLLEILSGRRAIDNSRPSDERNLVTWARHYMGHKSLVHHIVDPRLANNYPKKGPYLLSVIAENCLLRSAQARPKMEDVVKSLSKLQVPDESRTYGQSSNTQAQADNHPSSSSSPAQPGNLASSSNTQMPSSSQGQSSNTRAPSGSHGQSSNTQAQSSNPGSSNSPRAQTSSRAGSSNPHVPSSSHAGSSNACAESRNRGRPTNPHGQSKNTRHPSSSHL